MSSMTSGVKILECPRTFWTLGAFSSAVAMSDLLEDELALGGLERVVVVKLLAAHELGKCGRGAQAVDPELAVNDLGVGVGPFALHAVDAQRLDLAAHVEDAVVHRVAEARTDVAAEDLAPALHHETGHRSGVAEDDDRAALLIDSRPRADATLDHQVASADRRSGERAGVGVDDDHPGHHVLAGRPADAAGDVDLGAVDHAEREVAEAALEAQPAARQQARAKRVAGPRIEDRDLLDPLRVEQPAQLEVDLPGRQVLGVEARRLAVDLRYPWNPGVELDQATGVELRLCRSVGHRHRFHTITALS